MPEARKNPASPTSVPKQRPHLLAGLARREWSLLVSVATMGLFLGFGKSWLANLSAPAWFSLMLAWLYQHTGSLYPGMVAHAVNNATGLILFYAGVAR